MGIPKINHVYVFDDLYGKMQGREMFWNAHVEGRIRSIKKVYRFAESWWLYVNTGHGKFVPRWGDDGGFYPATVLLRKVVPSQNWKFESFVSADPEWDYKPGSWFDLQGQRWVVSGSDGLVFLPVQLTGSKPGKLESFSDFFMRPDHLLETFCLACKDTQPIGFCRDGQAIEAGLWYDARLWVEQYQHMPMRRVAGRKWVYEIETEFEVPPACATGSCNLSLF